MLLRIVYMFAFNGFRIWNSFEFGLATPHFASLQICKTIALDTQIALGNTLCHEWNGLACRNLISEKEYLNL